MGNVQGAAEQQAQQRGEEGITINRFCPTHSWIVRNGECLATVKNEHAEVIRKAYEEIFSSCANDAEKSNVISEEKTA